MNWREDKTLLVLCSGLVFFAFLTITVVVIWPQDAQVYTLFGGVFSQFSGALMMHLTGGKAAPAGSTTITSTEQVTRIPQEPKVEEKP